MLDVGDTYAASSGAMTRGDRSREVLTALDEAEGLQYAGASDKALALLQRARALQASPVERYLVGEALLRASNARLGWDLYDLHPSRPVDTIPRLPRWDGKRCPLLVVMAEQGFGDCIQFLRFVPQILGLAHRLVIAVHDELLPVVASSPLLRDVTVMGRAAARTADWPAGTRWERLMSVPSKIANPRIEVHGPYLVGDRTLLPLPPDGRITVGLAWRSTPRRGFPNRSFPARLAGRLVDSARIRVVALHRTRDIATLPAGVETAGIGDFAGTAAVISQCDYVVAADTVAAHLAPALGVPTFVCLRHRADWRWGSPSNPTRWYPHAELLFQSAPGDWASVLSEARARIDRDNGHSYDKFR